MLNTSIILQNGNNFIDLDTIKKKEYICRLLNLDIFEILLQKARSQRGYVRQKITEDDKELSKYNENEITEKLTDATQKTNDLRKEQKNSWTIIERKDNRILSLSKKITRIKDRMKEMEETTKWRKELNTIVKKLECINVNHLTEQKRKLEKKMNNHILEGFEEKEKEFRNLIDTMNKRDKKLIQEQQTLTEQLRLVNDDLLNRENEIQRDMKELDNQLMIGQLVKNQLHEMINESTIDRNDVFEREITEKISNTRALYHQQYQICQEKARLLEQRLEEIRKRLKMLESHEYNPDCSACMKNQATVDKISYQQQLQEFTKDAEANNVAVQRWVSLVQCFDYFLEQMNESVIDTMNENEPSLRLDAIMMIITNQQKEISQYEEHLRTIEKQKVIHEHNQEIKKRIDAIKIDLEQNNKREVDDEWNLFREQVDEQRKTKRYIDKINTELKEYEITKTEKERLENWLSDKQDFDPSILDELEEELKKCQLIKRKHTKLSETNSSRLEELGKITTECQFQLDRVKEIRNRIKQYHQDLDRYIKVINLMDKEGLIEYLLNGMVLPKIKQVVNNILGFISGFRVMINYDKTGIKIYKEMNGKLLSSNALCGFERFITNIAFRLAFNKINGQIKPDFLIIDEGFSCCDEENTGRLKALFDYIKRNYSWCLVITHLEEIRNHFDSTITIGTKNGKSVIRVK